MTKIALFGYVAWVVWIGYHYFFCPECRESAEPPETTG